MNPHNLQVCAGEPAGAHAQSRQAGELCAPAGQPDRRPAGPVAKQIKLARTTNTV